MSLGLVAVGDILECKYASYCRDQLALNILHMRMVTVAGTPPTQAKVAEGIESLLAAELKAAMSVEAQFLGASFRNVYPAPIGQEFISTLLAGAGTVSGDVLPLQVTGMITKRTNRPGRSFRGRMYVPFPGESNSDSTGTPNTTYIGKLDDISFVLKSAITPTAWGAGTTAEWIVYARGQPLLSELIISTTNQKKFATQRRRGSYGRPNAKPF